MSIRWEPTLSTFCPMPITCYTCSWEVVSTGWVAATKPRNDTLQEKERRASFRIVGSIWFSGKHCRFWVENKIIIPLPPWQGVVSFRSLQIPTLCYKEDSCFGYAAISICNRGGKHAHSYPRQCSDLLLTLKMDLPDIRYLVHANCYGK